MLFIHFYQPNKEKMCIFAHILAKTALLFSYFFLPKRRSAIIWRLDARHPKHVNCNFSSICMYSNSEALQ